MIKSLLLGILCLTSTLSYATSDSSEVTMRYQKLTSELRCLVCQNENLADSDAPLAKDLRQQIQQRISQGQSDEEIITYLTDRYGEFILFKPSLSAKNFLLWFGPFLFLIFGFGILGLAIYFHRKKTKLKTIDFR